MIKKLFLPLAALTITACQPEPNVALRIDCGEFNDQGVAITLNGKPIGDCPLDIMTHAGQTDISVNKTFADASYLEGSQSLMLAENVNKRVKFELQQIYGENYYYKKITKIADAREYLKRFPQGKYAQQVGEKLEDWIYEKTTDLSGMNDYLKLYPEGRYAPQVAERKELRYYEGATDISGIEDYIKNYPQGKFISVVKDMQEEYYANKAKTPEGIKDYKERYPEGKFISLMPERLEDYYYSKVSSVVSATKYMELYPNGRYYKEVSDKRESLRLINKRYLDNLDGTVTDKKTGLVWMRCTYGQKWNGENCTGNAKKLNWSEANSTASKTQFANKKDWRLPTKEELNSIIYCSKGSKKTTRYAFQLIVGETEGQCAGENYQKPTIDLDAFPNTLKDSYWSKSEDSSNAAWYLYFGYAFDSTVRKSDRLAFRLVSGGTKKAQPKNNVSKEVVKKSSEKTAKVSPSNNSQAEIKKEENKKEAIPKREDAIFEVGQEEQLRVIDERYYDNEDGTITDKKTGLVWMRCSLGQRWNGKTCNGEAKEYTWYDATKLTHQFAGSTAWRLPTIDELDSLVYCSKGRKPSVRPNGEYSVDTSGFCLDDDYQRQTINIRVFPNTPAKSYWSSSPYAYNSDHAWFVHFYRGYVGHGNKDYGYRVRLVRAGQ